MFKPLKVPLVRRLPGRAVRTLSRHPRQLHKHRSGRPLANTGARRRCHRPSSLGGLRKPTPLPRARASALAASAPSYHGLQSNGRQMTMKIAAQMRHLMRMEKTQLKVQVSRSTKPFPMSSSLATSRRSFRAFWRLFSRSRICGTSTAVMAN
jgi:hypothetical protein